MSNLPVTRGGTIDYADPQIIDTIRNTVALDATPAELNMFIAFCQSTGLNPFKREIWFIKTKAKSFTGRDGQLVNLPAKVQMLTGINGFFQIANKHPQFDGMTEPEFVEGPDGLPIKCTVRVYRKDRQHPSTGVARWKEYFPGASKSGKENWDIRPFHMLAKVAKSIALREAFPQELNGLFTEDEYTEVEPIDVTPTPHPLDSVPVRQPLPPTQASPQPNETPKQAATRLLMKAGSSWVYSPGFIEVQGAERRSLWATLVRNYGAVTDPEGMIHTSVAALEIAYALVSEPGAKVNNEGGNDANAV